MFLPSIGSENQSSQKQVIWGRVHGCSCYLYGYLYGVFVGLFSVFTSGVPVGQNMSIIASWGPVVDAFRKKLVGWKAKCLSFGGRFILTKAVLGSVASYLMSIYLVPMTMIKELQRLRSVFFLGADLGNRSMYWVRWDKVLAPKYVGGLGVGNLFAFNRALLLR